MKTYFKLITVQYGEFEDISIHENEEDLLSQIDTCNSLTSCLITRVLFVDADREKDVTEIYIHPEMLSSKNGTNSQ